MKQIAVLEQLPDVQKLGACLYALLNQLEAVNCRRQSDENYIRSMDRKSI